MNIQKFTKNSIEAVQNIEKIAMNNGNQELTEVHFLKSLLELEQSLIKSLLTKMNVDTGALENRIDEEINKLPKVQGSVQNYYSNDLNKVLVNAEDIAKGMKDEYVSVEHLFLCLLKYPDNTIKNIFKDFNITREAFLTTLSQVRGNKNVTTDNP